MMMRMCVTSASRWILMRKHSQARSQAYLRHNCTWSITETRHIKMSSRHRRPSSLTRSSSLPSIQRNETQDNQTNRRNSATATNRHTELTGRRGATRLQPISGGDLPTCPRYDASRVPSAFAWTRDEFQSASRLMRGTRMVPYRPVYDNDRLPDSSDWPLAGVRMHSITAMPFYEHRSFEELRLEDTRPHNSCGIGDRMVSYSSLSKVVVLGSGSSKIEKRDTHTPPLDKTNDDKSCVICLENRRTIAFFPCRHMCACLPCSRDKRLINCPVCREEVVMKTTIYW